jgi:hypothetical protein
MKWTILTEDYFIHIHNILKIVCEIQSHNFHLEMKRTLPKRRLMLLCDSLLLILISQ